jgi:hypothetical protein
MYIHCQMMPMLLVVLQWITTRIVMVSWTTEGFSPNYIILFYSIIATKNTVYFTLLNGNHRRRVWYPDVDALDIFDANDEADQHKKPRAKEYPSETILGDDDADH